MCSIGRGCRGQEAAKFCERERGSDTIRIQPRVYQCSLFHASLNYLLRTLIPLSPSTSEQFRTFICPNSLLVSFRSATCHLILFSSLRRSNILFFGVDELSLGHHHRARCSLDMWPGHLDLAQDLIRLQRPRTSNRIKDFNEVLARPSCNSCSTKNQP